MIVEIRQLGTLIYNNVSILTIYEIILAQIGSTKNHEKVKTTRKKEDNENELFYHKKYLETGQQKTNLGER